MSPQNFDHWNEKKKKTHVHGKVPYFNAGEIWWIQIWKNIGSESLGKGRDFLRPALVLQKVYGTSALVIPLTCQKKKGTYYHFFEDNKGKCHTAILAQIRYVDGKRFYHQLSYIARDEFLRIQQSFFRMISK